MISSRAKHKFMLSSLVVILALLFVFREISFLIRVILTILFLAIFYITDHLFKIDFKLRHYVFALIIAATGFLFSPLYYVYLNYDKILHFVQPMLFLSMVFHMVSKLRLALKWEILFSMFIVIGGVGLFEIGEYTLDYFFDLQLQGVFLRDITGSEKFSLYTEGLDDTMIDMVFGIAGSLLYSLWLIFANIKKFYPNQSRSR